MVCSFLCASCLSTARSSVWICQLRMSTRKYGVQRERFVDHIINVSILCISVLFFKGRSGSVH